MKQTLGTDMQTDWSIRGPPKGTLDLKFGNH